MDYTFEELKVSAEAGNAEAQYELGMKYVQEREDYIVNPDSAFYWLEAAATQGYLPAQKKLGELYNRYYILSPEYGWRVRRFDDEKSYKWRKAAADSGDAESMYYLGTYHEGLKLLTKHGFEVQLYMAASDHFQTAEKFYLQCIQCESPVWSGYAVANWAIYTKNVVMNMKNMTDRELLECTSVLSRCVSMLFYLIIPIKLFIMIVLICYMIGESTEAIKMYQCAIDSGAEVGPIYLKIAMVYENDEDYPNAIATYKKIIEGGEEMSPYCKELAEEELKKLEDNI